MPEPRFYFDTISLRSQHLRRPRIAVTGTIGILKASVLDGSLSPLQADEILQAMIDAGYYAPTERISDLL